MNIFQNFRLIILTSCLYLSGCIKLLPDPGPDPLRVDLQAVELSSISTKTSHDMHANRNLRSIKILLPNAPQNLNSLKVRILRHEDNIIKADVLAAVEWKDHLPELVHACWIHTLQNASLFSAVGHESARFQADWLMQTDISAFDIVQKSNRTQAHIRLTVSLIDRKNHHLIHQKIFDKQEEIQEQTLTGYMQGLNQGFLAIQHEIILWIQNLTTSKSTSIFSVSTSKEASSNVKQE